MPSTRTIVATSIVIAASAASAQTSVSFPDFSNTNGLTLSGSATALSTSDGDIIRLAARNEFSGSVFSSTPISAAQFSAAFSFRITDPGGITDAFGERGADGLVFVVQTVSDDIGGGGGGLGYSGIAPSVAVEFDTFGNTTFNDPSSNHVGIDVNGSVTSLVTANFAPDFDNGEDFFAWVDYNGQLLTVSVSETNVRPAAPLLSLAIDIPATIGQGSAFVGFTAGTASAWGNHDLLSFSYDSTIPAPAGAVVLGLGGLAASRRRR
ncbi:MAG: hypothetical protein AAGI17_08060 [Planctomycetota bacterium]